MTLVGSSRLAISARQGHPALEPLFEGCFFFPTSPPARSCQILWANPGHCLCSVACNTTVADLPRDTCCLKEPQPATCHLLISEREGQKLVGFHCSERMQFATNKAMFLGVHVLLVWVFVLTVSCQGARDFSDFGAGGGVMSWHWDDQHPPSEHNVGCFTTSVVATGSIQRHFH